MSLSRRFVFTWNNPTEETTMVLQEFAAAHCRYLVYGREVGPNSGTPHFQGFFILSSNSRIAALRKRGITAHLEKAKGTSLQASQYCKKDGDFVEFGNIPQEQGRRTDLQKVSELVKAGSSLQSIADAHPETFIKFGRGIRDLKLILETKYDHDSVRGEWYVGSPGTGKSYTARKDHPDAYLKSQNKWFDGYNGETVIILDDLDKGGQCLGHYLKIWSDRYACTGETKGGTINLKHKKFVVTSNYSIETLWGEDPDMCAAIKRRFTVKYFGPTNAEMLKKIKPNIII